MKNLLPVLVLFLIVTTVKTKHKEDAKREIVRIDVLRVHEVDRNFTLHIPRTVKFGQDLVNEAKDGFIFIKAGSKSFCYKRPVGISRNEYYLDEACSDTVRYVELFPGDTVNVNFSKSNMISAENVPMFGEGYEQV